MTDNPTAQAREARAQELAEAQREAAALRLEVRQLRESGAAGAAVAAPAGGEDTASAADVAQELEAVKKQLDTAELRNKRLKEVFQKNVQEFREACYELTGYRVDVVGGTQYRLQSMYAEGMEDTLVFQSSPSGMQLLDTPFSASILQQTQHAGYLQRFNSIPAFLSSLTLDLFSRQTMM